jgi:CBS domain containing-hemolysin-like protein
LFLGLSILFIAFFLAGAFALTALSSSLRRVNKTDAKKQIQSLGKLFFYRSFHRFFFPTHEYEGFFFAIISAQNIVRFCYVAAMLIFLSQTQVYAHAIATTIFADPLAWLWLALSILGLILLAFVLGDYLPRIFGTHYPETAMRACAPLASMYLILAFPLTFIFLKLAQKLSRTIYLDPTYEPMGKDEIIDMIQKADISSNFDVHDKKLIESVVMFKERIVREVMVPRVDMFSLPADVSIKEAAKLLEGEWFSRTPVYRNTVDNIVGVLMSKDILKKYSEYEQNGRDSKILEAPIESIQKNVLHVPETKKISSLLQEFRKKQVHLAIVVDEYGGTEGIVTIEDILEEIVGDISDEYDEEEVSFFAQSDGAWVVDARMSILDVEEELNIKIPQEGEYDTIGGYVFHTAGTIPERGFVIHHDEFEMEILQSNDRCVEKVRIKPVSTSRNGKD